MEAVARRRPQAGCHEEAKIFLKKKEKDKPCEFVHMVGMALRTMLWGCLFGLLVIRRLGGSSWGHIRHAPHYSCPASNVPLRFVLRGGKGREGLASTEAIAHGEEGSRERGKVPLQSCRGLVGGALCDCSVNQCATDSFATKCV